MSSFITKPRLYMFSAAVIATCTVAGVTASTSMASSPTASASMAKTRLTAKTCTVLDNMSENTVDADYVGSQTHPMTEPGDTAIYYDNIYDSVDSTSGAVIGNAVGYMTGLYKLANGDLIVKFYESVQLPGGTIRETAIVDRTAELKGAAVTYTGVGTSGSYLGDTVTRVWQMYPPAPNPLGSVKVTLCP